MNSRRARILPHVGAAVGDTPLVALDRLASGLPGRVAIKLEYFSPGGSIKDRPALACLEEAEAAGILKRGQWVVEKTSGNMGAGLAWACAVKGYRFVAVMSAGNTPERRRMIEAFGGTVVLVPQARGGTDGQVSREDLELVEAETARQVQKRRAFLPDQFNNPACVRAHERGTGREIWEQTAGAVSHFCSFAGTAGTISGVGRALKRRNPRIRIVVVEPKQAQTLAGKRVVSTSHVVQGGGYAMTPAIYDPSVVDATWPVSDRVALRTMRDLAREEGIMAGISTGANVACALALAAKAPRGSVIVTVACDTGLKYLSLDTQHRRDRR
ncbi:MAG: cysteine synthase family protein [Planctomycetes bacterium]|nr:cysteine synthase family protein [Planctomycetota bacterium]